MQLLRGLGSAMALAFAAWERRWLHGLCCMHMRVVVSGVGLLEVDGRSPHHWDRPAIVK
jgi:hypothetical protein